MLEEPRASSSWTIPVPKDLCADLSFSEKGNWFYCGPRVKTKQGWKLYVPLTNLNALDILPTLVTFLSKQGVHFKYVADKRALTHLNSGRYGYSQVGKCMVIYLEERCVNEKFITKIKSLLRPFKDQCPEVPLALPFGDGLPLFYRFGSYTGKFIEVNGMEIEDIRDDAEAAVPKDIEDVLAPFTTSTYVDPQIQSFLLKYPVFEAILQQGKCGVFLGLNLESDVFQEVILKSGYFRGQLRSDGADGCSFVRREIEFYQTLKEKKLSHLAPRMIDSLDVPKKAILVLEYINGDNMMNCLLKGKFEVHHLETCWSILGQIHQAGMYIGDAKIANFILSEEDDIRIIDFETAGSISDPSHETRTFFLSNPDIEDPIRSDLAHFLVSVLYPYDEEFETHRHRFIDLQLLLESDQDSETEIKQWARQKLIEVIKS